MGRFRSSEGPLVFAAATGSRSALLCFDVSEGEDGAALRETLVGFVLGRERLAGVIDEGPGNSGKPFWIGDPRRLPQLPGQPRPSQEHDVNDTAAQAEEEALAAGAAAAAAVAPGVGSWRRALEHPIRDFKWGDYALDPGTEYRYTLCAVRSATGQRQQKGLHVAACVTLQVSTAALHGGSHEVHFNRGVTGQRFAHLFPGAREKGCRDQQQWAWLSRGLEEALLHFIDGAQGSGWKIYGALYEAHYLPVMRALARAMDRGVDVALVVDWKTGAWSEDKKIWTQRGPQHLNAWALQDSGLLAADCVFRRTKPLSAISHNKFFILVDPAGEAVAVWTGSTNVTAGAIFGHSNVGHVLHDPRLCAQYLAYWEKLKLNPEKREIAAFSEDLSPIPTVEDFTSAGASAFAIFAPRLRWAAALDFFAQLVRGARQCVVFTAAFGISRELAPALLGGTCDEAACNSAVPRYVLLEGEGQWAASRDAVRALRARWNVRVAHGMHMETSPADWLQESLTGLNQHVKYVHTKLLMVDPFSDQPVVVSGSANFSRASMESNDENMVVVRGDTGLADAYVTEFFRIFEHMRFRNQVDAADRGAFGALAGAAAAGDAAAGGSGGGPPQRRLCGRCGVTTAIRICNKPGPNLGRSFLVCPRRRACGGVFCWLDAPVGTHAEGDQPLPWPQRCFQGSSFDRLERQTFGRLAVAATSASLPPSVAVASAPPAPTPTIASPGATPAVATAAAAASRRGGHDSLRGAADRQAATPTTADSALPPTAAASATQPEAEATARSSSNAPGVDGWMEEAGEAIGVPHSDESPPSVDGTLEAQLSAGTCGLEEALEAMGVLEGAPATRSGGEPASTAAPAAAEPVRPAPAQLLAEALRATYELLEVDSCQRGGGGVARYKAGQNRVRESLAALPEGAPGREEALTLLSAMEGHFVAKRKSSWKPYLLEVLLRLGEPPERVATASRTHVRTG